MVYRQEGVGMVAARGGAHNVQRHDCVDGERRELRAVYMRDEGGSRAFRRVCWYCAYCGWPWSRTNEPPDQEPPERGRCPADLPPPEPHLQLPPSYLEELHVATHKKFDLNRLQQRISQLGIGGTHRTIPVTGIQPVATTN